MLLIPLNEVYLNTTQEPTNTQQQVFFNLYGSVAGSTHNQVGQGSVAAGEGGDTDGASEIFWTRPLVNLGMVG